MSNPDRPADDLKNLTGLDKLIHEPGRLAVMAFLYVVEETDFLFLMDQTGLTRGNLSAHMAKLSAAGYVDVQKMFVNNIPRTTYRLTDAGRAAFKAYRQGLVDTLNALGD